jgi:hypothetical protein
MKYTKPQITHTENASFAIMNTGLKTDAMVVDSINPDRPGTDPAYSADE